MNKYFYKIISISIISLPIVAFAQGIIPSDAEITANGFCAFAKLINTIITRFLQLSTAIAAITFAIAGAKMLMNPDNASKREDAKKMFFKTVVGLLIVLGAWLVIHTIIITLASNPSSALRFLGDNCHINNN